MWFGFGSRKQIEIDFDGPMTLPWEKNARGRFHKLLQVRPSEVGIGGRGGVAVFFHRGVRPGWVFVCAADDLGELIANAKDDPQITEFEGRGGVFVAWSFVKPGFRPGVVAHLRRTLRPAIEISDLDRRGTYDVEPIPVHPPA